MKRMTKGGSDNLREGGTQGTAPVGARVGLRLDLDMISAGDMAQFVNHGALLRHHQQQQEP
jgi:hypothetical protein